MKKVIRLIIKLILLLILLAALFFGVLTVLEYKPADDEVLEVSGGSDQLIKAGDTVSVAIWNIGYCALGDNADFFMDGGDGVITATEERTVSNLEGVKDWLASGNFDIIALQEIDIKSRRSYCINEYASMQDSLAEYNSVFANNYKAAFVPFPIPPLGRIDSGIATFSRYSIDEAHRLSLPCPFSWPVRTCNLKRCLEVNRIPIDGSDRYLVVINLHLEAYDSGEGKNAQTNRLLEVLNSEYEQGNYVIALGDFNQLFTNVDASAYPVDEAKWAPGTIDSTMFGKEWQLLMDNSTPTCRSLDQPLEGADKETFQYYLIDGAIASDNIDVQSIRTNDLGFVNSDHNPVSLKLKLEK